MPEPSTTRELTVGRLVALALTTVSGTVTPATRLVPSQQEEFVMPLAMRILALAIILAVAQTAPTSAAEREQVRMVINLVAGVKMPFPEKLRNNLARTERVQLDANGATVACLRF